MAKPSMFRDFMKALRKAWAKDLPSVRPGDESNCGEMPRSSTFNAGVAPPSGLHVFLHFDHSQKSWQVGQFRIGFVLSKKLGYPEKWALPTTPIDPASFTEGSYYLIHKYNGKHWLGKVWHLVDNQAGVLTAPWFASNYADRELVFREAIADVTQEVTKALDQLGICVGAASSKSKG
jgi:hypothetical protein